MGRERPARGRGGGGESIPPVRTIRLRIGTASAALLLAVALAVFPALRAGELRSAVLPLAVLAVLSAVAAVAARGRLTGAALFLLAAEYVLVEVDARVGPVSIVLYAVGLVVLCELLLWSGQLPRGAVADRAVVVQRMVTLGLIAAGAALAALLALAAAGLSMGGSYRGPLAGVAAAVVVLSIPWVLLRRTRSDA